MITLRAEMSQRYPIPPVFCKKSPQAIENKRGERRKERQERKRVRKGLRTRDLLGEAPSAARKKRLKWCGGEGRAGGKIICECWRVHCGWRWVRGLGGRFFLALRQVASKLGEQVSPSDQASSTRYGMGVRQDNWSEGRFGCRWLGFFCGRWGVSSSEQTNSKSAPLKITRDPTRDRNPAVAFG